LAFFALAGCSSKTTAPAPTPSSSTVFKGTFAAPSQSGSVKITVSTGTPAPPANNYKSGAIVAAIATMNLVGGGSFGLSGSYDTGSKNVAVSDGNYTFFGGLTSFGMEGTYSGPGGVNGGWTAQNEATAGSVTVYCGTFTSNTPAGPAGRWNVTISGTAVHGLAVQAGSADIPLEGTLNGSTIYIVNPANPSGPGLATGTISGSNMSGTYNTGSDTGTWSGTICP
jgi:hypothetical protein